MRDSLQALLAAMPRIGAVDEADDGAAALRRVAASRPALLVLDTNLSDGAAWSVLKEIKSRWPQTQCVILAQSASQRETAQAAGADGVLIKGFSTAELYVMIDELLARRAGDVGQGAEAGQEPAATSAGALDGGAG
jgi:DNA-binding NarL/FixJ family response regulator